MIILPRTYATVPIYPIFSNIRGWKGISIEHVEKLASDKEVDSYSKSLKIGDYL